MGHVKEKGTGRTACLLHEPSYFNVLLDTHVRVSSYAWWDRVLFEPYRSFNTPTIVSVKVRVSVRLRFRGAVLAGIIRRS